MIDKLPTCGGSYVLVMQLAHPQLITPGRLGRQTMPAGYYCYAGSAFGPGGLRARLRHHATPVSRPHWHVDYLRQKADLIEIWYTDTDEKREHDYASLICKQPDTIQAIAGFGASDCNCTSHLIYHPMQPDVRQFRRSLAMNYPGDKLYSTSVSW
ncbi:MAG TPA: DUF123 domain-containing protein [Gammaproteobacteria bacterium]|nr:DUF123 domain-containing protein [Gammaproteobacteria bacterium]